MFKYIIIILLVFTSFDAIGLQSRDNTTIDIKPVVDDSIVPVPVVIYQDTLFYISNGIGSHDINERANDIAQKAESLINDFSFEKNYYLELIFFRAMGCASILPSWQFHL